MCHTHMWALECEGGYACVCVCVVNRHGSLLFGLIKKLLGTKGHTPVTHRLEPGSLSQTGSKVWGSAED